MEKGVNSLRVILSYDGHEKMEPCVESLITKLKDKGCTVSEFKNDEITVERPSISSLFSGTGIRCVIDEDNIDDTVDGIIDFMDTNMT